MSQPLHRPRPVGATAFRVALLAGAAFALGGPAAQWLAIEPGAVQMPVLALYVSAAALAGGEAVPRFWRAKHAWPLALGAALRGFSTSLALFALLRVLPELREPAVPVPSAGELLALAGPYLQPFRSLSIAVLVAGVVLSLYRASFPVWRPVPAGAAVRAFAVSLAARYLLDSQGPVTLRTGLDLSFYMWPVWSAAAGYAAFWLVRFWRVSRRVHMLAAAVLWVSLVAAAYMAFHYLTHLAVELTVSDRYQDTGASTLPYLLVLAGLDSWAAAGVAILGVDVSTSGFTSRWQRRRLGPLFRAARSLAIGVVVWGAAQQLQPVGILAGIAGVVAFCAFAAIAVGQAGRLLATPPVTGAPAAVGAWLAGSQFRNANIGGIVALYATVLRPALYETTRFAPMIEWLGLALPVAYLIARASGGVSSQTREPPTLPAWRSWRVHRQDASPLPDIPFARAASIREGFVQTGAAPGLAVRVVTAMAAAACPIDDIVPAVRALVDPPAPPAGRRGPARFLRRGSAPARARAARSFAADAMEEAMKSSAGPATVRRAPGWDAETLWAGARKAFVDHGDRVRLGVAATMVAWSHGVRREVLITQFGRIVQYRDPQPRWYDLPAARRRMAENTPVARTGFADQLRPLAAAGQAR